MLSEEMGDSKKKERPEKQVVQLQRNAKGKLIITQKPQDSKKLQEDKEKRRKEKEEELMKKKLMFQSQTTFKSLSTG